MSDLLRLLAIASALMALVVGIAPSWQLASSGNAEGTLMFWNEISWATAFAHGLLGPFIVRVLAIVATVGLAMNMAREAQVRWPAVVLLVSPLALPIDLDYDSSYPGSVAWFGFGLVVFAGLTSLGGYVTWKRERRRPQGVSGAGGRSGAEVT